PRHAHDLHRDLLDGDERGRPERSGEQPGPSKAHVERGERRHAGRETALPWRRRPLGKGFPRVPDHSRLDQGSQMNPAQVVGPAGWTARYPALPYVAPFAVFIAFMALERILPG